MKFKEFDCYSPEEVIQGLRVAFEVDGRRLRQAGVSPEITQTMFVSHAHWYKQGRPFLNLYPSIYKALLRTRLTIDPAHIPRSTIHELGAIEVRLPETEKVPSFLLSILSEEIWGGVVTPAVQCNTLLNNRSEVLQRTVNFGTTANQQTTDYSTLNVTTDESLLLDVMMKLALGALFLASDLRYLEPVLLKKDRHVYNDSEALERAVQRARRKGIIGFNLGEKAEKSPHFRCPHFAIRWKGKGGTRPELVPVKASVVHKDKLNQIPSGYRDSAPPK